jgi:DNA-binding response OmpR family regulator
MDNQYTLLLVEDDSFLIEILVKKFKDNNFNVIHAGNGKDALRKAHDEDPDIIMLDIILPGMNGFEILEKLKNDETVADIPVAFLSNLGQKEDIEKGNKLGAVDFIVKANHSLDEIVKRTEELIKKHRNL